VKSKFFLFCFLIIPDVRAAYLSGTQGIIPDSSPSASTSLVNPILIGGKDASGALKSLPLSATGLKIDGSGFTQTVYSASLPLPSGASTSALQSSTNGLLLDIKDNTSAIVLPLGEVADFILPNSVVGVGVLDKTTGDNQRLHSRTATDQIVSTDKLLETKSLLVGKTSGNIYKDILTDSSGRLIVETSTPSASLATTTLQSNGNASLSAIDGKLPSTLGTKTKANSLAVTLASDENAIVVSGAAAAGATPTVPPVSVSGIDGGGLKRHLLTDTSGKLQTDLSSIGGTDLISGQRSAALSIPVTLSNENINDLFVTGASGLTTTVNNILPEGATASTGLDLTGYRSGNVQVVSTATGGTIIFEGSNDPTNNFQSIPVFNQITLLGTMSTTAIALTSSAISYSFAIKFRYIRLRIATTATGGTVQSVSLFSRAPWVDGTLVPRNNSAHSVASPGNAPLRVAGRVVTTLDTTLANNDVSDFMMTTAGQLITKDFGSRENDWTAISNSTGIVNTTTAVTLRAAGAASIKNCLTNLVYSHDALGAPTHLVVRDGATGTVGLRLRLQTPAIEAQLITLPTPHCGSSAALMEIATETAVTGGIYYSASGYQAL